MTENTVVFETIRPWLDEQGFTPERITALDTACALLRGEIVVEGKPAQAPWVPLAAKIIKEFEGCHKVRPDGKVEAYPDPGSGGDPWTIGFGSTGPGIRPGTVWTKEECEARFLNDLNLFGAGVISAINGAPTTPHQMAALTSFAYNVGLGGLRKSTVLRKHREGDYSTAAQSFGMWNKAAGKVMAGLTRRRAAEAALYRSAWA